MRPVAGLRARLLGNGMKRACVSCERAGSKSTVGPAPSSVSTTTSAGQPARTTNQSSQVFMNGSLYKTRRLELPRFARDLSARCNEAAEHVFVVIVATGA